MTAERWLLAMDTATPTIVIAAGTLGGVLVAEEAFEGRYRHSQELLPALVRLIERSGRPLADLGAVVAGTGPGAFTGLRVGLSTAKTLAHELRIPIVGVSTAEALLASVDGATELWLPSGPRDRVRVTPGTAPVIERGGQEAGSSVPGDRSTDTGSASGRRVVAVDLEGRAPDAALRLGREAVAGLAAALLRLGAARLARGEADDPERLVPAYASPPRGAPEATHEGGVAWSRDPR